MDLHVHSRERSACSRAGELELVQAAVNAGLDGLAFTDHDRLTPPARLEHMNRKFAPFLIYGGIEITLAEEHVVVLGIQDPALESGEWEYPDLWQFVRQHSGFISLAHPFRFHNHIGIELDRFPPDGIEVYSNNIAPRNEERIRAIAVRLGIRLLGNSDAHQTFQLGKYYNDLAQEGPLDEQALVSRLKLDHSRPVRLSS
jgi:predicted metal-dependent phosphoesterase TrpH